MMFFCGTYPVCLWPCPVHKWWLRDIREQRLEEPLSEEHFRFSTLKFDWRIGLDCVGLNWIGRAMAGGLFQFPTLKFVLGAFSVFNPQIWLEDWIGWNGWAIVWGAFLVCNLEDESGLHLYCCDDWVLLPAGIGIGGHVDGQGDLNTLTATSHWYGWFLSTLMICM